MIFQCKTMGYFMLDDETTKKLDDYCAEHNITRAEAIRQGIHLLLVKQK